MKTDDQNQEELSPAPVFTDTKITAADFLERRRKKAIDAIEARCPPDSSCKATALSGKEALMDLIERILETDGWESLPLEILEAFAKWQIEEFEEAA